MIQNIKKYKNKMDDFRKELDEMLGKDRNLPRAERLKKREHFDDNDVYKYFLVAFCPHELFINTRNDIGRCKKRHDSFFKQMYLSDANRLYYQKKYELSLLGNLSISRLIRATSKHSRCQNKKKPC